MVETERESSRCASGPPRARGGLRGRPPGADGDRRGEGRPRDPDSLPHAARELVRKLVLEPFEAGHDDETRRALPAFRGRQTELFESEFDVGPGRPPREKGELLEDGGGEGLAGAALPFED